MSPLSAQMKHRDREMVPRILVQAMFTLMIASLALVSFAVLTDRPRVGVPQSSPVAAEIALHLDGDRDGTVVVRDPAGQVLARSDEKLNGFIGVIWRAFARERMLHDVPAEAPIRVVRRENGHVAVLDPATGMEVELVGYGQDNVAAFARLIDG